MTRIAEMIHHLDHSPAISILEFLRENGTGTAQDIGKEVFLSPTGITHYLKCFLKAGIVTAKRRHPYVDYSINKDSMKELEKFFRRFANDTDKPWASL